MERDIKDYLHLYLGCELDTNISGDYVHPYGSVKIDKLSQSTIEDVLFALDKKSRDKKGGYIDSDHIYCKLILRPLSDMTEEEVKELFMFEKISKDYKNITFHRESSMGKLVGITVRYSIPTPDGDYDQLWTLRFCSTNPYDFKWLLSKGFDLFNLIPDGLAIDATTISKPV